MHTGRKVYGYYPPTVRRDSEVIKMIEKNNKIAGRIGFCAGLLGVGGYLLCKKVNDLSKELKKIKEEMGKQ